MDWWVGNSWGREFVAGGIGGVAGVISGYPLDTIRILQQNSNNMRSAFSLIRNVVSKEGPTALYRGMAAPLASVAFQNAMVFQTYAVLSRSFDSSVSPKDPPSYKNKGQSKESCKGPLLITRNIWKAEGLRGIFRGFGITVLRDAPRGLAGVVSWIGSYPLDVIKTRLQAQTPSSMKYKSMLDCVRQSIREEGYDVLWRGLGTTVGRAFVVNGAVFAGYEIAMRSLSNNGRSEQSKISDPTNTPSQPNCIIRAASAGVTMPPEAKCTTGSLPICFVCATRSTFPYPPQCLPETSRPTHKWGSKILLVDVILVIRYSELLAFIDVIDTYSFENLSFHKMPDSSPRNYGNRHNPLDLFDERRIHHSRNASSNWLSNGESTRTCFLRNLGLFDTGDLNNGPSSQHLSHSYFE
ncbi:mitochondrial arginine transporter BAC2 [Senna tora]|uniref:Mitochondrial arginine transporter BAC2 n=1 Tax=Senna tora TaxID=362788 RepID=A0A834SCH0_9FABA|nr:mitochondrial arginine transporter BAC2 [Senna tora]